MSACPLSCGAETKPRAVDAGGITVFICSECLGVAFDAVVLCDPRRQIDLSRLIKPVVEKIRRENSTDPLTQTRNRAFFFKRLSSDIRVAAHRSFISVAGFGFDIEGLYARYGSRVGDTVVQSLAASLLSAARLGDDLARVEPDAFGLILRSTDEATAQKIAVRVAESVQIHASGNGRPLDIRLVVATAPADDRTAEDAWDEVARRIRTLRGWSEVEA